MTVMNSRRHLLHTGIAAAMLMAGLAGCSATPGAATKNADEAVPVTIASVVMSDVASPIESGGVVQARTTATITSRILAPVREIRVAPGDHVRAGQVLLTLDGRDIAAVAHAARANAQSADQGSRVALADQQAADAALVLARTTHDRVAGLQAKRSATTQELDDATAALREAEARVAGARARAQQVESAVESARASSDAAATTESYAVITAPFDGMVTEKMVEPGNMAAPGTPLLRLEDTRGFRLEVRVDESRIAQVRNGAIVPVVFDEGPAVSGTVSEIGRAIDADARAFLVKISLPDANGLRSGLFGRARFSGPPTRALTIPAAAIVRRGQITSVFVVEKDVAHVRLVSLKDTEVLAGLSESETVVVSPPAALSDGRRVNVGVR